MPNAVFILELLINLLIYVLILVSKWCTHSKKQLPMPLISDDQQKRALPYKAGLVIQQLFKTLPTPERTIRLP